MTVKKKTSGKKILTTQCSTCGEGVGRGGHLCVPVSRKDQTCSWCGSLIMDARHMCNLKLKKGGGN